MKLVIAIVMNSDLSRVIDALSVNGFFASRTATTGQFLSDGYTMVFVGTQDEKVENVFKILEENTSKRKIEKEGVKSTLSGSLLKQPIAIEKGGAVAFVIDVEDFRKF